MSIDRINVNGDYEPSNCRWATSLTQMNNTRRSRYVTYNNETHTVSEWARIINSTYSKTYRELIIKKNYKILDRKEDLIWTT